MLQTKLKTAEAINKRSSVKGQYLNVGKLLQQLIAINKSGVCICLRCWRNLLNYEALQIIHMIYDIRIELCYAINHGGGKALKSRGYPCMFRKRKEPTLLGN